MERQTVMEFYLAESENTGNPNTVEIDSYFTEQRIFALAALGVPPGQDFESEFLALKKQHGLEMPRLRLSDIYNKPSFVGDLIDMVDKQHWVLPHFACCHCVMLREARERVVVGSQRGRT